ncbi:MAG: protein kinase [Anaerolineae bacterium]|nr:protein kinase [Anaerolineae bacterium]
MSQGYNLAVVRELLLAAFTAEEMRRFCLDHPNLSAVCQRFGEGAGLDDMVDEVISYVRTRVLLDDLLAAVKAVNPRQYARFEANLILPEQRGNTIGEYEIVAEIGRGGMGVVYRGYQASLDRYLAIKVLPPELGFNQAFLERFQREARAVAKLRHPNIVVIHDVGEDRGTNYLVMEFLEGRTLQDVIDQAAAEGPLSPERAVRIVEQIASALDYAHERGFVHRDVKPANIFVGPTGPGGAERATLTDFGIAKAIGREAGAAEPEALTRAGTLMGTPEYMSPEQAAGEEIDHRADLYALGVVVYEIFTGRAPFQAPTPHAVLHQIIYEPPPQPCTLNPAISPEIEAVILKAIAKRPEERFQSGAELAQALHAAVGAGSTAAVWGPLAPPRTAQPAGTPSRISALLGAGRTSPQLLVGGMVAVLVLVAVVLIVVLPGGSDGDIPTPTMTPAVTHTATLAPTETQETPTDQPTPSPATPIPLSAVPEARIGRLVFSSNRDGNPEIYVLDLAGSRAPHRLTNHAANDWLPDWSPDGTRIVFTSARSGGYDSWVMNADGSDQGAWVTTSAWDEYPRWAPDGERVSFSSTARTNGIDNSEIFVRQADGTKLQITHTTMEDQWADWAPDGRLAYTEGTQDESDWDIYISNGDGSARTVWIGGPEGDIQPAWSPDGKWIAFVRLAYDTNGNGRLDFEDNGDVWVGRVEGGGLRQLTSGLWAATPAWSPDGWWIAFAHLRDPNQNGKAEPDEPVDILAVPATGGDTIEVVASPYRDGNPSWTGAEGLIETPTPTASPVVPCAIAVDAELASAWERTLLGCPIASSSITWAAWQEFERGGMVWRNDTDTVYTFVQTSSAPPGGRWQEFDEKWDGSYPDGVDMSPPPRLYEPVRGFGALWRNYLGGPTGELGWAREEEKGFCARVQPFELGFVLKSDTVEFCRDELFNWAREPSFVPLVFSVRSDGTWRRYY